MQTTKSSENGSQHWVGGQADRLKAAKKLKAMRALQASLGPDESGLAEQLEQGIATARRVANGGRPLEAQEEEATAALAEARVKFEGCMNTLAQVLAAKDRAEVDIEQRKAELAQIKQQRRAEQKPAPHEYAQQVALQMAGALGSLRQSAVWAPTGDKVAVDPSMLENLAAMVTALATSAQQQTPPGRTIKRQQPETYDLTTDLPPAAAFSGTPEQEEDSDDDQITATSDSTFGQAMRLTQIRAGKAGISQSQSMSRLVRLRTKTKHPSAAKVTAPKMEHPSPAAAKQELQCAAEATVSAAEGDDEY